VAPRAVVAAFTAVALAGLTTPEASAQAPATTPTLPTTTTPSCPWATPGEQHEYSPAQLAAQVLAHMTLDEKIDFVGLTRGAYENVDAGIPRLCIPTLTLEDGPDGVGAGTTGVTQLPASIGVAASFDPKVAAAYGSVLGREAKSMGVDAIQGPNLNVARLPNSGRIFEGYGEDPTLVSAMGVAEIDAVQAEGIMAMAKHFAGYTQETARPDIDQTVSERVLQEIYYPPFEAAVQEAHVASVMCALGRIDGIYACEASGLFKTLDDWGFAGFVRSDIDAVADPTTAFDAGLDLIKPASTSDIARHVLDGQIPVGTLDDAVSRVLTEMFRFGLIEHPRPETVGPCACGNHAGVALTTAERSMVLLKNADGTLPLTRSHISSVAVIGQDAGTAAATAGHGSAHVVAPFLITPIAAITHWAGRRVKVTFSPGGPVGAAPSRGLESGDADLPVNPHRRAVTPQISTADAPGSGPGWLEWDDTLTPTTTGTYEFSLTCTGDTWLTVNGRPLITEPGEHGPSPWSTTLHLVAGRPYRLELRWFDLAMEAPELTWTNVTPMIDAAVRAARHASIAVVFANDFTSESFDRPTLDLDGDANALISAVAAANPRTVVVLNTGGAVVMPWLSKVAAVLEAWYPGEEDGAATMAVLSGAVDPSGHLPLTFPTSAARSPMGSVTSWPGVDGVVSLGGLDEGYRYYDAAHLTPLFPFGYGLSYTSFSVSDMRVARTSTGVRVSVRVSDDGARAGRAVVQVYVRDPEAAREPAHHLGAFASVPLRAGRSRTVRLTVPTSEFEVFVDGAFRTVGGRYTLSVGQDERDLPLHATTTAPHA